jgi:anti-anti-sigma factor
LCGTELLPFPTGEITVLWVAGEVDLGTISVLESALERSLGRRPAHLVVDLARLRYCSARGVSVLVHGGASAAERGVGYVLCSLSAHLDRTWERLWPGELPTRCGSAAAAVADIRAATVATIRVRETRAGSQRRRHVVASARGDGHVSQDGTATASGGDHGTEVPSAHKGHTRSTARAHSDARPRPRLVDAATEHHARELRQRFRAWLRLDIP